MLSNWTYQYFCHMVKMNSLPYDIILDVIKLKVFANDKINFTQMFRFVFDRVENIVGEKEKMLVISTFTFSYNVFKRLFRQGRLKSGLFSK